jgi:hypothetical protein
VLAKTRAGALPAVLTAVWLLLTGCGTLPGVPEEILNTIEGEYVTVVARHDGSNPTEQWMYTYLMLEVSGPEPGVKVVEDALAANGWEVDTDLVTDLLLVADIGGGEPGAHLVLVTLRDFTVNRSDGAAREFTKVSTAAGLTYYVAIVSPTNYRTRPSAPPAGGTPSEPTTVV